VTAPDVHAAINAVFRMESARLIAGLTRLLRDVGVAEELAQDALVIALERWPEAGVPHNPGAWLMAVAKRRALNVLNRNKMLERKHQTLAHETETETPPDPTLEELEMAADEIGDDRLRLIFTACHPVLSTEARVALTLRLLGGLSTDEIARAFLVSEPTIAQRIVRAKRTLAEKQVPFEVPRGAELGERLASVLGVVYLVFNEGNSATAGDDTLRPALADEAMRLGRILAELAPEEPEVHGLLALMEITASRFAARTSPTGDPVLLLDQDRSRWDRVLVTRGLAALSRAEALAPRRGPYVLQAAITACHALAATPEDTDWAAIVVLYDECLALSPSPIVALNRAVAVSMAEGPGAGLALLESIDREPALRSYHLLPSARADMLERLGRHAEARAEFERAASLTENTRQRERLLARAERLAGSGKTP
jgi:RNA polymerase sigma-70 factor, ECF subfamily